MKTRLSRRDARLVVRAMTASVIVLAIYAVCGYLFILNRRISSELLGHQWRTPTEIYTSAGGDRRLVARVYGSDWRVTTPVLIDKIPPHVAQAFIAAEDIRFRSHIGVDPIGIARALLRNVRSGGIAQGGSTIPQQLIKTKFLTQERTYRRKVLEMLLAVMLDARLSKDEILELYLNDVYLGHQNGRPILGLDEASRLFFDRSPAKLTASQAAVLAGMIRAPNRDNPAKRPDIARARRDAILNVMHRQEWLTDAKYRSALAEPVSLRDGELPPQPYPYFLAALRAEVEKVAGAAALRRGRLAVVCTMDPVLQRNAEDSVRKGVASLVARYSWLRKQSRTDPLQAALLSVDPRTGGIRALVGGTSWRQSRFDRTSGMRRQPGSAFKTFAYVAAIDSRRYTNATLLLDAPLEIQLAGNDKWSPHNYDEKYRGRVTLRESFEKSLNVPTIRVTQELGVERVSRTAEKMGIESDLPDVPALPLGVSLVTMREITRAYTAFPNLGVVPGDLYLLEEVRDAGGKRLFLAKRPQSRRVIKESTAFVMHSLLRGVVRRGTAARLSKYGLSHAAGKTGTTNDYRDAWFVGYTPDLVTTTWVGFDRGLPLRLSSAEAALPIWGSFMGRAGTSRKAIEMPEGVVERQIDPESGYLWAEGCPGPVREVFLEGTAPRMGCPRGILGRAIRDVLFNSDSFDEPAAITFDKFRRWSDEAERERVQLESTLDKLRRFFGGGD